MTAGGKHLYLRAEADVHTRFQAAPQAGPAPYREEQLSLIAVVLVVAILTAAMTFMALTLLGIQHQLSEIQQLLVTQPVPLHRTGTA